MGLKTPEPNRARNSTRATRTTPRTPVGRKASTHSHSARPTPAHSSTWRRPKREVSRPTVSAPVTPPRQAIPQARPYCQGVKPRSRSIRTVSRGAAAIIEPAKSCELRNSRRRPRWAMRWRQPAVISRRRLPWEWRGGGAGSGVRRERTPTAESRKLTASTVMVQATPIAEVSAPPIAGPALYTVQKVASKRPFATSRSSGPTRALRWAPLADAKRMVPVACRTVTTQSWVYVSLPVSIAAGTLMIATKRRRSAPIITGRLRRNSIHGPAGRASAAAARPPSAASSET